MKIILDYEYDKNEIIIVKIDDISYKFDINGQSAIVSTSDYKYIEDAVKIIKEKKPYVYKYHSLNNDFYQEFDKVFTFKLPINVIQPSKFFIDKEILGKIDENIDEENVFLPVAIINDEYVLLDGHARLYALNENYIKMVNVYIEKYEDYIPDFIYIAKENNIKNIKNLDVLEHDDYEKYWNEFLKQFNI